MEALKSRELQIVERLHRGYRCIAREPGAMEDLVKKLLHGAFAMLGGTAPR